MTSDDFFLQIEEHFNDKLPFVVYRKPNETQLKSLLQNNSTLHKINDFTESGFVFAPFDDPGKAILIPVSNSNFINSSFVMSSQSETSHKEIQNSENQKHLHINLVRKAIAKIKKNELQKVVVSRHETIQLSNSNSNSFAIFKRLLNTYPSAFVYSWYHPKVGLWLGATPETLLSIEGNRMTTMALAGTQQFVDTEDVVWQEKEKDEQRFVTDFIVKSIQSSVDRIQVSEPKTVKSGNLLHLKTDIKANLKPETLNLKQILQNLHPTPAVCGLPKEEAKQFILNNEDYNREYYSGFLGELNLKEKKSRNSNRRNVENDAYGTIKSLTNLYVNLRCGQIKDNQAIIYVGGGITKDSVPENEWEETVSKSHVIKSVL